MLTNEELKKKIVKGLKETINWTTDYSIPIGIVYKSELDKIADALIAAGIGDVKDLQAQVDSLEITNIALQAGYDDAEKDRLYWVDKYKEAEHRVEVAEKMFDILHEESSMYMKVFSKEWYKQQAEKELAEEGKEC